MDMADVLRTLRESASAVGKPDRQCVLRLNTEGYIRGDKVCLTRTLNYVKKLSTDPSSVDWFWSEATDCDVKDFFARIVNLNSLEDGLYALVVTNQHYDWESGILDDWDLMLVPYTPPESKP